MFTQSCFIKKISADLSEKLEKIGYKESTYIKFASPEITATYCKAGKYSQTIVNPTLCNAIDCGENEQLFLAITALRDDTEAHQWFVHKSGNHWWKSEYDSFLKYFNESNEDSELKYEDFHKATVEELIEYFNHGKW